MNMIVAFIRPKKWPSVREALEQIEVERMTVADTLGFADHFPDAQTNAFPEKLSRFVLLEIIVNDDFLEKTIDMIVRVARTGAEGHSGDGKIFVLPVEDVVRVYDGYHGKGAV